MELIGVEQQGDDDASVGVWCLVCVDDCMRCWLSDCGSSVGQSGNHLATFSAELRRICIEFAANFVVR